jgi:hypothetical protein
VFCDIRKDPSVALPMTTFTKCNIISYPPGLQLRIAFKIQRSKKVSHPFEANLSSHLNLSQLQIERWRSLADARDDRYIVDYHEEEVAIRK